VVRFHNKRGTAEQIRDGNQTVKMTNPFCHRFRSNQARLALSLLAYQSGQFERVDNLGAYSIPSETGLLIPSVRSSFVSQGVQSDRGATLGLAPAEKREL
jgi:hypothetical protein